MISPLSLEGWNVEGKMAQFENYVNDHLRYYKDQVRRDHNSDLDEEDDDHDGHDHDDCDQYVAGPHNVHNGG